MLIPLLRSISRTSSVPLISAAPTNSKYLLLLPPSAPPAPAPAPAPARLTSPALLVPTSSSSSSSHLRSLLPEPSSCCVLLRHEKTGARAWHESTEKKQ
eukprot:747915-Hanusia_phi.AAC.1